MMELKGAIKDRSFREGTRVRGCLGWENPGGERRSLFRPGRSEHQGSVVTGDAEDLVVERAAEHVNLVAGPCCPNV